MTILSRFLTIKEALDERGKTYWLIAIAFAMVIALEYITPPEYVFGYLYTGTILLADSRLNRGAVLGVTFAATGLTLLNLFVPGAEMIDPPTVANRLIAVLALLVTGWLSNRNRRNEEAITYTQAKLRSQEQLATMREDFVSTLTHDLKTPLLGAIETLKYFQNGQFGEVTPIQEKVLQTMARSHRSTLQLVQTLLDVYRNDAEGLKLQRSPVNLVIVAEEVIATLTELARTRQIYISLHYGESDFRSFLWVNGDSLQLGRVFTNLLSNGINHTPRGGKVEIVLEGYSNDQVVKILDTGSGFTEEELPHLFERFYQGDSDRHVSGYGLGLYLTRQIITAHGGTIWAENRSPRGALFGFRLPACPPPGNGGVFRLPSASLRTSRSTTGVRGENN
jgi:two-component system, NarL family, sensor kinase